MRLKVIFYFTCSFSIEKLWINFTAFHFYRKFCWAGVEMRRHKNYEAFLEPKLVSWIQKVFLLSKADRKSVFSVKRLFGWFP
jgi:hypothetical protein